MPKPLFGRSSFGFGRFGRLGPLGPFAVALLSGGLLSCGVEEQGARTSEKPQPIINGDDAMAGQFPTVVGLLLDAYAPDFSMFPKVTCKRGAGVCTGTFIREDVILTAAHCVTNLLKGQMGIECPNDPDPPKYTQEMNLIAAAQGGRVIATKKVVVHPKFSPVMCTEPPSVSQWNDLALVFLTAPMAGAKIQKWPSKADVPTALKEGNKVSIVGYGKSKLDDNMSAGVQRHGTAALEKVGPTEIQIAKMGERQQGCQGDSGGPVFANPDAPWDQRLQIGVASRLRTARCPGLLDLFNPPKCENGVFYTRVDAYDEWIRQTIDKEAPNPPAMDMSRPPDPVDMATPPAPEMDMASEEMPDMKKPGCGCKVGGAERGHGGPLGAAGLLAGAFSILFFRRRRQG